MNLLLALLFLSTIDTQPPVVQSIQVQPEVPRPIRLTATVDDNERVALVKVFVDGVFLGEATPAGLDAIWSLGWPVKHHRFLRWKNAHQVTVRAWDFNGNLTQSKAWKVRVP